MRYAVNQGPRSEAVRVGMEVALKQFVVDYAADMGMSESAAARRMILIGARCEAEHGNARMPASFAQLFYDSETAAREVDEAVKQYEQDGKDDEFDWEGGESDGDSRTV
ncbi:hypothetical protein HWC80_gp090 [Mycobacterium phage Indlulamithi]|uniref:Uncharacterized protein n=1 Tax=Mycobacterium phage Indlulamithi TaxID=2656582 RepID=A0A649VDU2_9CAUD|nr:hypothetical protein HWC80_gp090 [Mycobacterium phage Indlulamithi]QGJ90122.1 hypothetical protein PBI_INDLULAMITHI_84 [Mycobacterium phage Indlulamithi]